MSPKSTDSKRAKKVFVGMSGGVDSSVSAAILKNDGYDVTGVFIKVWQPDFLPCGWREERLDAMRVCAKLGIPFLTFDFEDQYKKEVVDYMIAEYKAGRTPNPDVMCNRHVKFGAFWQQAKKMGADFVATGHYAQIRAVDDGRKSQKAHYQMLASVDEDKDQTYFIWTLTQNDLEHILFPVGGMKKERVRSLARKYSLPNAEKKDSQGLCFMGKVDMKAFLKHYLNIKKGDVLDDKKQVVGTHDGAFFYTIGQRHGFSVASRALAYGKTSSDRPLYIVDRDVVANTITVSHKPEISSYEDKSVVKKITIENAIWNTEPIPGKKYFARFRYRQELRECKLVKSEADIQSGRSYVLIFSEPQMYVSPGQSLVLYEKIADETMCLGGGIISSFKD